MKTKILFLCFVGIIIQACSHAPIYVGHRGSLLGVENTREAFVNGATHFGYNGLECDVKVTIDSQLVCWHDDHLKRVGVDSLLIPNSTLAELQTLTLTQTRKDVTYTAHLCTVDEYLGICQEYGVFPVVELKWAIGLNNNDMTLFPELFALIEKHGLVEETVILTSMQQSIAYIREHYPQLQCQWLRHQVTTEDIAWCLEWGVNLSVNNSNFDSDIAQACKEANLPVAAWTINDQERCEQMLELGCYMITTDYLDVKK